MTVLKVAIAVLLILAGGGLALVTLGSEVQLFKDVRFRTASQAPGARRRMIIFFLILAALVASDAALFGAGFLLSGPEVGAILAIFGFITWCVVGFVLAFRNENHHGNL